MGLFERFVSSNTTIPAAVMPSVLRESSSSRGRVSYEDQKKILSGAMVKDTLSPSQLRRMCRKSSAIRPVVDSIVREIANMPWFISPINEDNINQGRIDEVTALFKKPNPNNKGMGNLLSQTVYDLCVLDRMVMEIVRGRGKKPVELWERDAATFTPKIDKSGLWTGYKQAIGKDGLLSNEHIEFEANEIMWCSLFPTTDNPLGTPIIDTIINETVALLFSVEHIASSFTNDEIPPGILWLGEEMEEQVWERVKASIAGMKGRIDGDQKLRMYSGGSVAPSWIQFKRSSKDLEQRDLRKDFEVIVWSCFGKSPVSMGRTDSVNRSNAEEQGRTEDSALIQPITRMISEAITSTVIEGGFGYDDVQFVLGKADEESQEKLAGIATKLAGSFPMFSINSIRKKLFNEAALDSIAADEPFMITSAGQPIFLSQLDPAAPFPPPPPPDPGTVAASRELASCGHHHSGWSHPQPAPGKAIERFSIARDDSDYNHERVTPIVSAFNSDMQAQWLSLRAKIIAAASIGIVERTSSTDSPLSAVKPFLMRDVEQEDTARRDAEIAILIGIFLASISSTSGNYFALTVDEGIAMAGAFDAQAISAMTDEARKRLSVDNAQSFTAILSGGLLFDLRSRIHQAMQKQYASRESFTAAIANVIDTEQQRVERYANYLYSVGVIGFVTALDKLNRYEYDWFCANDEASCDACISAAKGGPYATRLALPFYPGLSPICYDRCRCFVRARRK